MPVLVREFRRSDRDQLRDLINLHVCAVLPGVALSTNVILSQLEREPGEVIVDPWIDARTCLVAVEAEAVVGAVLLHRFSSEAEVADGYRGAAELRWLVVKPRSTAAGKALITAAIDVARTWSPTRLYADAGSLPAPGCYGVPNTWPHIRALLTSAGFIGPTRTETVLVARCEDLLGNELPGTTVRRTVGELGARLDIVNEEGTQLGYIEVGEINAALTRSTTGAVWSDVGNLFATKPDDLRLVMPALLTAAAKWLMLGGVGRVIDYYADDVHTPDYLENLRRVGFVELTTNERGWELRS